MECGKLLPCPTICDQVLHILQLTLFLLTLLIALHQQEENENMRDPIPQSKLESEALGIGKVEDSPQITGWRKHREIRKEKELQTSSIFKRHSLSHIFGMFYFILLLASPPCSCRYNDQPCKLTDGNKQ